jgi:hypothetical protein
MKKLVLLITLIALVIKLYAQPKKILWIGNSYVASNNLPQMFYNLALSGGDTLIFDSNIPGGFTLSAHTNNATTLQKIAQPGWDYVIIQAQSQEPSFPPSQVESQTLPFAIELDSLVHAANPCAKTVFYMTWGRRFGDDQNCQNYPPLCTFEGMTLRLRWGYKIMAEATEAIIAPAGMAWKAAIEQDPNLNLWVSDNSHPALSGSYLTACTFYTTIFRKPSLGLSFTAGLETSQVNFLQGIADATVNDSLDVWNIDRWTPQAGMSYLSDGLQVNFQQESFNSSNFYWDFGDGNTSTLPNPNHTFENPGEYEVSLIAGNGCVSDTLTETLQISVTNATEKLADSWRIFPNPADKLVLIQAINAEQFHIAVYSSNGKLVKAFDEEGSQIKMDFSDLEPGIYQIVCSTRSDQKIFRIMKD